MLKPCIEWLEQLDEPYKSQAIQNMNPKNNDRLCHSKLDALTSAFDWEKSPQKHKYWYEFARTIIHQ